MRPRIAVVPLVVSLVLAVAACSVGTSAPTPTPVPSNTPTPAPPTPTPFPTFTPTPVLGSGAAIVVGGELRVRAAPTTQSEIVGTLDDHALVQIARPLQGENVLVGGQRWVSTIPPWTTTWYELADGTYVYGAYIFVLGEGEASPWTDPEGAEKWIDVNVTAQTASAMIGDRAIYTAPVSTGQPAFPTPLGTHEIQDDGRLPVERMTASQAGYNPSQAQYDVERVLFTQYFDRVGDALHLNYWRPVSVFGTTPTSHGCVGMQLHDAQYFWLFGEPGMRVEIHA